MTEAQKQHVRDNYKKKNMKEMARDLQMADTTIRNFMIQEELTLSREEKRKLQSKAIKRSANQTSKRPFDWLPTQDI